MPRQESVTCFPVPVISDVFYRESDIFSHGQQFHTSWPTRMRIALLRGLRLYFGAYEITEKTVET